MSSLPDRLDRIRRYLGHHRCTDECAACEQVEQELDLIQAEILEILDRLPPPAADTTPARITLTAS